MNLQKIIFDPKVSPNEKNYVYLMHELPISIKLKSERSIVKSPALQKAESQSLLPFQVQPLVNVKILFIYINVKSQPQVRPYLSNS